MCSFIKGGIVFADHITTVSPTYAQEIQTAYYGDASTACFAPAPIRSPAF